MLEKSLRGLSILLAIISASSIVVLMLAIVTDVTVRTLRGSSVPGVLELAESCLVVAVFFGLAWAGMKGEHVSVSLIADRFGPGANRVFAIVAWALSTGFLAWLLYASVDKAISATRLGESRFGLMEWPLYPWRWAIAIGVGAFLLVSAANLVRAVKGQDLHGASSIPEIGGPVPTTALATHERND